MRQLVVKSSFWQKVKKYHSSYHLATKNRNAFISSFLSGFLYLPIELLVTFFVWYSLYQFIDVEIINGFTLKKMFAYFFIVKILSHTTSYFTNMSYMIWTEITQGTISKFLCRPIGYIKYHFFYGLGYVQYNFIISIPILFAGTFLFGFVQTNIFVLGTFLFSLILAMGVTFLIFITIGIISFWTEAIFGLRDLVMHVGAIFSGSLIPLQLMPNVVSKIGQYLPFRTMVDIPVSIYLGHIESTDILFSLGLQVLWIIILSILLKILWHFGIQKYEAYGG